MIFGCPVKELMSRMDSDEFTYWIAYFSIEPLPDYRQDLHAGIIASTVANCAFGRKKGSRTFKPSDFMIDTEKKKKQTAEEQLKIFKAFVKTHNAKFKKRHGSN